MFKSKILLIGIAIIMIVIPIFSQEDEFKDFDKDEIKEIEIIDMTDDFKDFDKDEIKKETQETNNIIKTINDNNILFLIIATVLGFLSFILKKFRIRYIILLISLGFLGFYIGGCNCSVGAFIKFFYKIVYDRKELLGIILLISIPIVSTLFFGRIFCGYVCPIGALQEFVAIKDKLIKISYKLEKKLKNIRILLFITLFVVTYIKSDFIFSYISPFKSIFNTSGTILQISIALIILILSLFIYRPFCRYACPLSLALEIVSKFSFYKIRKDKDFCNGCKSCQKKCNITAIDENNNIDNVSCIRCGDCLDCVKINNSKRK